MWVFGAIVHKMWDVVGRRWWDANGEMCWVWQLLCLNIHIRGGCLVGMLPNGRCGGGSKLCNGVGLAHHPRFPKWTTHLVGAYGNRFRQNIWSLEQAPWPRGNMC
jgi:hypothetical protein